MKKDVKKSTETTITLRNDDRKLLADTRLLPNTRWLMRFGFFDDLSPIHVALIRSVDPTYDMKRTVQLTLFDLSLNLSVVSSSRNWGLVPSCEIARQIAKIHDMEAVIEISNDKPKKAFIQPNKTNDLQYLRDLATQIDFELSVEGNPPVLYYRKKNYQLAPAGTLTYYDDPSHASGLLSFHPKVKSLGAVGTASSGANTKGGKDGKKATDKDASLGGKAPGFQEEPDAGYAVFLSTDSDGNDVTASYGKDPTSKGASTVPTPTKANPNVAQVARQQMLDRANEADVKHMFTASLDNAKSYTILGVEKQVSGNWYASEISHSLSGSSSSTDISLKRNAKGKGGKDAKNPNDKNDKSGDVGEGGYVAIEAESEEASYVPGPQARRR